MRARTADIRLHSDLIAGVLAGGLAGLLALGLVGLPLVAIPALFVAIGALWIAFTRPMAGLVLALALNPFEKISIPTGAFQFTASDLLGIAAAAGWLLSAGANWRDLTVPKPVFAPLLLLLSSFIPSTILAADPGSALKEFAGWTNFLLLLWMVAAIAGRREIRTLLGAIAFAGGLAGALTILNPGLDLIGRASGPFGQPNTLGQFITLAVPVQIYFALRGSGRVRLAACIGLGLSLYGLSVSLSRASWGGIVAVVLLLLFWRPSRLAVAGVAAAVTVALLIGFNPARGVIDPAKIANRITASSDPSNSQAASLRSDVYSAAPRVIADHPLGVGAQNFNQVAGHYGLDYFPFNTPITSSAENLVLGLGTELGVLAMIALAWLCVACGEVLVPLWRSEDGQVRGLALTLIAVLISQFVVGMFHYGLHSNPITLSTFVVIGCAVALRREVNASRDDDQRRAETR